MEPKNRIQPLRKWSLTYFGTRIVYNLGFVRRKEHEEHRAHAGFEGGFWTLFLAGTRKRPCKSEAGRGFWGWFLDVVPFLDVLSSCQDKEKRTAIIEITALHVIALVSREKSYPVCISKYL